MVSAGGHDVAPYDNRHRIHDHRKPVVKLQKYASAFGWQEGRLIALPKSSLPLEAQAMIGIK